MSRKTKIAIVTCGLIAMGAAAAVSHTGGGHGRWMDGGRGKGEGNHHGRMHGGMGGWFGRPLTKDAFDQRTRERFAGLDRNSDGVIEAAEVGAAAASRMKGGKGGKHGHVLDRLARQFDDDRDSRITRDEYLAGIKRRFAELDLDRDGRITDADLPPMMRGRMALSGNEVEGGKGMRHARMGPLALLAGADANKDGVITWEEATALAVTQFARHDRNGDGVVDAADLEALRAEMVDYRVKRTLHHHGAGTDGKLTREQFMAKANERFARLDRDNDGVISRAEMPGRGKGWHGDDRMSNGDHGKRGVGPRDAPADTDSQAGPVKGKAPPNAPAR